MSTKLLKKQGVHTLSHFSENSFGRIMINDNSNQSLDYMLK